MNSVLSSSLIPDNLEKYGISVWVDVSGLAAGVDFLSKIGEAIIDCKVRSGRKLIYCKIKRCKGNRVENSYLVSNTIPKSSALHILV